MNIIINGEKKEVSPGCSISDIVRDYRMTGAFAVEVNGLIIDSSRFADHRLQENDIMEIIRFVGGG